MSYRPWTTEEDALARRMAASGETGKKTARMLGRTHKAIRQRMNRIGFRPKRDRRAAALAMLAAGVSPKKAALEAGVSMTTIYRIGKELAS